jgi:hypothetical protein
MEPVLVPWDCADGFFEAYWRRPEAYLDDHVRRAVSVWTMARARRDLRRPALTLNLLPHGRLVPRDR